jgi:hypothetical protein
MTKTAIRRKEKLTERSLKKKQAKKGIVFEEVGDAKYLSFFALNMEKIRFL